MAHDQTSCPASLRNDAFSDATAESAPPHFDRALNAWVLSRYSDVLSALRTSSLVLGRFDGKDSSDLMSESTRLKMRAETMQAVSAPQITEWRERLAREAAFLLLSLSTDEPVDLLESYARPLCLQLAAWVTNISPVTAESLIGMARVVSAAAADPDNAALKAEAGRINPELISHFDSGPLALRESAFVAISQTIPCLLGNAWLALIKHSKDWTLLHLEPAVLEHAVEELLRYAGLVRALFRTATEDVDLNGTPIRYGDQVILRIIAANRDLERFDAADQLDLRRHAGGHLALGAGLHACVGASLIRMAVQTITGHLVCRFAGASLARAVEWEGGSTFQSPQALWVRLIEEPA